MVPKVLQHKDDNKALEPPPAQVPLRNVEKEKPKILEDKKQEDEVGDDTEI